MKTVNIISLLAKAAIFYKYLIKQVLRCWKAASDESKLLLVISDQHKLMKNYGFITQVSDASTIDRLQFSFLFAVFLQYMWICSIYQWYYFIN